MKKVLLVVFIFSVILMVSCKGTPQEIPAPYDASYDESANDLQEVEIFLHEDIAELSAPASRVEIEEAEDAKAE